MNPTGMDRREFHQLSLAALTGVIAGVTSGCVEKPTAPAKPAASVSSAGGTGVVLTAEAEALIMDEPHTCRGLNSCSGKGRSGDNSCAGQGTCASIPNASCSGQTECKGQGGCGTNPGMNDCKGLGGCHIPLMASAWETARTAFETAMKKNGNKFGEAPPKEKK